MVHHQSPGALVPGMGALNNPAFGKDDEAFGHGVGQ